MHANLQFDQKSIPVGLDSLDLVFNLTENSIVNVRKILISAYKLNKKRNSKFNLYANWIFKENFRKSA